MRTLFVWPCAAVLMAAASLVAIAVTSPEFEPTGSMTHARIQHTASMLADGRILVAGGNDGAGSSTRQAEIYDPGTGSFTGTGTFVELETGLPAVLADGRVLFALDTRIEIYDPATGSFGRAGNLIAPHRNYSITRLVDGRVLFAGGIGPNTHGTSSTSTTGTTGGGEAIYYTGFAQLYDPASGTSQATGTMIEARTGHTATLLDNGKVLIAGGTNQSGGASGAELYDPTSGTFSATGPMVVPRNAHTAVLLPSGQVLIAGGAGEAPAEIYDPKTGTFTVGGSFITPRVAFTASVLPNGDVLIAGGADRNFCSVASAERYVAATRTFVPAGEMTTQRAFHASVVLRDGRVLLAGGYRDLSGTTGGANCGGTSSTNTSGSTGGTTGDTSTTGSTGGTSTGGTTGGTSTGGTTGGTGTSGTGATTGGSALATFLVATVQSSAELYTQPADTTPPTVTCAASPSVVWPPNHRRVAVTVDVVVTDAESGPAGYRLTAVDSSEADAGLANDDVPSDVDGFVVGTPDTQGQVRAERYANAGRTYTLTYVGSDVAGNTASCTTTVSVAHDLR